MTSHRKVSREKKNKHYSGFACSSMCRIGTKHCDEFSHTVHQFDWFLLDQLCLVDSVDLKILKECCFLKNPKTVSCCYQVQSLMICLTPSPSRCFGISLLVCGCQKPYDWIPRRRHVEY